MKASKANVVKQYKFKRRDRGWLFGGTTHAITPYAHGWELVRGGGGWSHGYDWGAGSDIIVLGSMVE